MKKMPVSKGYKFGKRKSPPPFSQEHRRKIAEAGRGRTHVVTEEMKRKHSLAMTGRKQSKETIEKRVSHFRKENHWNWKGGEKHICAECGEEKSTRTAIRCRKCSDKFNTGENSPIWKGGIKNKLILNRNYRALKRKAEGSFTLEEWELLKKQYGFKCPKCSKIEPEIKLTVDHIIPLSKGGSNYIENIQPLCYSCNSSKGNRIIIKYEQKNPPKSNRCTQR